MKIKKGEIVIYISPDVWNLYKNGGWRRLQEPTQEMNKRHNETQMMKKSMKGGSKDVKSN
jgi:hypothetical protein